MTLINSLNQIDNSSLVDRVETRLVELLQSRHLKIGDTIPTELELCTSLGVSRTVVREALLRLRLMGLIDTKKKRGTVITSPDIFAILGKSMNPHILDEETLREIFELRLTLEIGMADFLFRNVTPEDIAELKTIVENEPAVADNYIFEIDHEIAFHAKLYDITGNKTMKKFQKMLLPIFDYVNNSSMLKAPIKFGKFVSHKGLVDILENGSPELFRNAMRNHLENHFLRLS